MREWIGRRRPGSKLVLLLLPIILSDIILIAINTAIYSSHYTMQISILNDNNTSLTFGEGKSSFHEENLQFLVDNNEKGSPKTLNVYGLDVKDTIDNSSSYLVDDTHRINTRAKVTITPTNIAADPKLYNIKIPTIQYPGSYEGWILVKGKDNIAITITIATEPKVVVALLWVIIGILRSIIFWEIINYVYEIKKVQTKVKKRMRTVQSKVTRFVANKTRIHPQTVSAVVQNRSVGDLPPNRCEVFKNRIDRVTRRITRNTLDRYLDAKFTSKAFIKVSIIDLGAIGFGIAVGFLALLSQVTTMRVIGPIQILSLIGLGLGVGSLREFLKKDS